jgi:hypothetical protein
MGTRAFAPLGQKLMQQPFSDRSVDAEKETVNNEQAVWLSCRPDKWEKRREGAGNRGVEMKLPVQVGHPRSLERLFPPRWT